MSAQPQLCLIAPPQEHWLTAEEAVALTGWTDRWLREKAKNGEIISRESETKTANGRAGKLYLAASFPAAIRAKFNRAHTSSIQGPLFADVAPAPAATLRIALPSEEAQAQAEQRLEILQMVLEYASDPQRFSAFRLADGRPVTSQTTLIQYIAQTRNVSERTLKLWLARFRAGGFAALADQPRRDKGVSRWSAQSEQHAELADLATYAYLNEHLNKRMAWEIVDCRAKQMQIEPPSYETIRSFLENLPGAVTTLALKGRREYDEIFAPYIRRGYTDFEAGEILVSDHAHHDVLVQNDLFDDKDRQHMRLDFTGLIDMRSRKVTGYAWSQAGSSRSIVTTLRHSIQNFGPPRTLYTDNGKDYQKVGKGAHSSAWNVAEIPPEAMGVLARLGISVDYCIKFHPQSKLIERFNNTMHQRFDRRWKTYTGPTPEQRPDRCHAALARHHKLLAQGRADESDLPLASEFIRAAVLWIEQEYHLRVKDVPGMEGLTPNEAFEQHRWTKQPPAPEPAVLACLLTERTTRMVRECSIELLNRRYVAADPESGRELHNRTGQTVTVAFDPLETDRIAAIDEDGYVFAYLEPETFLRQAKDAETQAAIGASMRERKHRYHETRDQLDALSRRVLRSGYVPQNDQMLQLGGLPIDVSHLVVHRPQPTHLQAGNEEPTNSLIPGQAADRLAERLRRNSVHSL
jgi:hypothetical protein